MFKTLLIIKIVKTNTYKSEIEVINKSHKLHLSTNI